MHKILVHAQHSCACTGAAPRPGPKKSARGPAWASAVFGSRPWSLAPPVHAQERCACTGVLCMHKNLVHTQESCACTRILTNKQLRAVTSSFEQLRAVTSSYKQLRAVTSSYEQLRAVTSSSQETKHKNPCVRPVGASSGFLSGKKTSTEIIMRIHQNINTFYVKTPVLDQ